jgi:hypothetical protein
MKKQLLAVAALVALVGIGHAQQINGGIAVGGSGAFTSGSLTLNSIGLVESSTGDLSSADTESGATLSTAVLSGLSSSPTTESINDFFQFSSPLIPPSTGTTPANRFDFDLTSITETNPTTGIFTGSGTLVDTTGALQNATATFTLSFAGSTAMSFSLDTVQAAPEPSSWALAAILGGAFAFLRFRRAAMQS